jgi:RNA-binding protein YhbY
MMGNALIQPTMYFNVRNIPLFSGPYMITSVKHRISENGFDTTFEGIRQPFYSLPKIENFIQSLNEKILTSIQEQIQENETKKLNDPNNVISEKNKIMSNIAAEQTLTANQDCGNTITEFYRGFTLVDTPTKTTSTFIEIKNLIIKKLGDLGYSEKIGEYSILLFSFIYVDSATEQGFESYENNFSTIDLKQYYGSSFFEFVNRKYYCVNRGTNINDPIVSFISVDKFLDFAITKVQGILTNSITSVGTAEILSELYVRFYPTIKNTNIWTDLTTTDKNNLISKFKKAIDNYQSLN